MKESIDVAVGRCYFGEVSQEIEKIEKKGSHNLLYFESGPQITIEPIARSLESIASAADRERSPAAGSRSCGWEVDRTATGFDRNRLVAHDES